MEILNSNNDEIFYLYFPLRNDNIINKFIGLDSTIILVASLGKADDI